MYLSDSTQFLNSPCGGSHTVGVTVRETLKLVIVGDSGWQSRVKYVGKNWGKYLYVQDSLFVYAEDC